MPFDRHISIVTRVRRKWLVAGDPKRPITTDERAVGGGTPLRFGDTIASKSLFAQDRAGDRLTAVARVEDAILKNLQTFVAFARKRLGDHHLAEDVVQDSLIKALAADRHPETDEETTTWFYRILRRSIIDVYRKQGAQRRALERFKKELPETPGEEDERELCQCFRRLLPLVPDQYRELLEEVDLKGKEPDDLAAKMGITRNNLTVRLHRGRKHLRKALSRNCGACSVHGCIDCTCQESSEAAPAIENSR